MLEAVFRGEWTRWKSDTDSASNKDGLTYSDGYFATKCATGSAGKKLIYDGTGDGDAEGLIHVADNGEGFIVHELNAGTTDVKYSVLRKYGGQTNEDLWHEFTHVSLNTLQLQVEINSIVTGSFGVLGQNNPKILDDAGINFALEDRLQDAAGTTDLTNKGEWTANTAYSEGDVVYVTSKKKSYKATADVAAAESFNETSWTELDSNDFIESIPEKATDTMQFTAREGFLYINGRKIQYAQSLSFSLDNGMTPKYAIFVANVTSLCYTNFEILICLNKTGHHLIFLIDQ